MSETISFKTWLKFKHQSHPFNDTYELTTSKGDKVKREVRLKTSQKVKIVVATIFVTLLTLPLLIVGGVLCGYLTFTLLSAHDKSKLAKKDAASYELENQPPQEENGPETSEGHPPATSDPENPRAALEAEFNRLSLEKQTRERENTPVPQELQNRLNELNTQLYSTQETTTPKTRTQASRPRRLQLTTEQKEARLAREEELKRKREEEAKRIGEVAQQLKLFMKEKNLSPNDIGIALDRMRYEGNHLPELAVPADNEDLQPYNGVQDIKPGLVNEGSTCWLNAALNYLATNQLGDDLCSAQLREIVYTDNGGGATPLSLEQKQEIQKLLRKILISLRTGDSGYVVDRNLMHAFFLAINPLVPEGILPINGRRGRDHDFCEFIRVLTSQFECPPEEARSAQFQKVYHRTGESLDNSYKTPSLGSFLPVLELKCSIEHTPMKRDGQMVTKAIDINQLANANEEIEGIRPDRRLNERGEEVDMDHIYGDVGATFSCTDYLVHAPEHLTLNIQRAFQYWDSHAQEVVEKKATAPIPIYMFTKDNETRPVIILNKYAPENIAFDPVTCNYPDFIEPSHRCIYAIDGAVCHTGSTRGGHYTYLNHAPDGKFIHHNDNKISHVQEEARVIQMLEQATTFNLVKLEEIPFDQEDDRLELKTPNEQVETIATPTQRRPFTRRRREVPQA